MGFVWIVIAGGVAGFIAGKFLKPNEYGPIGDIAIGIAGALVATLLFRFFGPESGVGAFGGLVVVVAGGAGLLVGLRVFLKPEPEPVRRTPRRRY
jgi:uncharacterized membrane protein YeaQ/YmgE (transglycosylase-associated protein family)